MTPQEVFDIVDNSIGIIQESREIIWATERIQDYFKRPIRSFVEFGCMKGGSLAFIAKLVAAIDAMIIGIDTQEHGARFDKVGVESLLGQEVVFAPISSLDSQQFLTDMVGHIGIDLFHIDSVHTAAHAEREWAIAKPLMASPSIVMVHDIGRGSRSSQYAGYLGDDIEQLSIGDWFQRIKYGFHYEEKKVNGRDPNCGIGLLYL